MWSTYSKFQSTTVKSSAKDKLTNKDGLTILYYSGQTPEALIAQVGKDVAFIPNVSTLPKGNAFLKLLWHIFDGISCSYVAHSSR